MSKLDRPLDEDIFNDSLHDPFSEDSEMPHADEEFNSSQVPDVTKHDIEKLVDQIPLAKVQRTIQPGAGTTDDEKRGKFLCWNNIGIIRAQYSNEDQNIDVMFHDTEKHTSVNFKNEPDYTLGSMSDDVIVLGSNGKYGSGGASIHGINLLESDPDKREWEVTLPFDEIIEALAVGMGFAAVATDQRHLRLFTHGGMQSFVLTLPNQVLCMAASERQLMIIYHDGAGLPSDQNLSMILYHIDLLNVRIEQTLASTPVALTKRSELMWAGFSDEGTPCTYDYRGMLRMFRTDLGHCWLPILDLRELTSSALDHYFVVGLSEITQKVRAVKCIKSRIPSFTTENAQLLDFSLPLCNMDTDRGQLEEEQARLRIASLTYQRLSQSHYSSGLTQTSREAKEKALVNTILRLFALYLREDKEETAKNLVYLMPKDHVSKLPEYAWKTKRRQHFIDSLNQAIDERDQLLSSLDMSDFSMAKDVSTNGTYKV